VFSDQPVTPKRLEILVGAIAEYGRSNALHRESLLEMLQPETLPDYKENSRVAGEQTLRAARDLGIVEEVNDGWVITESYRGRESGEAILVALDNRVLADTEVEPYFALFYSFLLGLGPTADSRRDDQEWASSFNNEVFRGVPQSNPFNATKVRGLWRWFPYVGLGWADSNDVFQCEPYDRVRRALPRIFGTDRRLDSDVLLTRLSTACPELDGGQIFRLANPGISDGGRALTLGLAQALVALHEDNVVVLHCPADSRGWDLSVAEPPNDGRTMRSAHLDAIEWTVDVPSGQRRVPGAKK